MNQTERRITRKLLIKAERGQVFRTLLDPGALSRWLFATVEMTPEAGSSFSFQWRDSANPATAQGEILELVVDQKLVLSWFMEADGVTSTATFDLSDGSAGVTVLQFTHSGLPQEPEWLPRFRAVALEWDKVLLNLKFLLEENGEGKHLFYLRTQIGLKTNLQRAYRAWTTTTALSAWLARELVVIAEEGQDLEGITLDTGKALSARFECLEAERHIRLTWTEGGVRGLLGVSFWPGREETTLTITLRSFALLELERGYVLKLWEKRFERLRSYLGRAPLEMKPVGRDSFSVSRDIEAVSSRVYNALTDSSLLRRWFVAWTDFEPRVGAGFVLLWNNYGEITGRVREVKPGESVVYSWDIPELAATTEVAVTVRPHPTQSALCKVEVEHGGWGDTPEWLRQREAHRAGWTTVLALLDFYLRHGAGRQNHEFHLRRRLGLPWERAVALVTTAQGLESWMARRATLDPKPGGAIVLEMSGGVEWRGRVLALHPSGEGAVEFDAPEPAFMEWGLVPEQGKITLALSITTYSASPEWMEEWRGQWGAALGGLGAG